MCATLILVPLFAYAIGLFGIIALYFVIVGGIALLYAGQLFLTRSASLPRSRGGLSGAPYSLNGRHVLITGGSKGIGHAFAVEAVKRGAAIITLIARDAAALQAAQRACLELADELEVATLVQTISADLTDPKTAVDCLDRAATLRGETKGSAGCRKCDVTEIKEAPIDVFFCNAADVDPRPFCNAGDSDLTRTVAMNLSTPLLQVKHVLPSMVERRFGVICFSNSLAAFVPIYGLATYSATKSALKTFAEAINQEVAGTGVFVANAFMPSVDTPGYQREKRLRHKVTEILESTCKPKQPEEVAERIIADLEAGHRIITVDFEGWACARVNAGFSRAESLASLFYEFFLGGIFRIVLVGLFVQFYSIITREQPAALRRIKRS